MSVAPIQQTILAVDDTPTNITLLAGLLGEQYKVRAATNGAKALEPRGSEPGSEMLVGVSSTASIVCCTTAMEIPLYPAIFFSPAALSSPSTVGIVAFAAGAGVRVLGETGTVFISGEPSSAAGLATASRLQKLATTR